MIEMSPLPEAERRVESLVAAIRPILAGNSPDVVSAALGELVGTWLAGNQGPGATEMREALLLNFVQFVREMTTIVEAEFFGTTQ